MEEARSAKSSCPSAAKTCLCAPRKSRSAKRMASPSTLAALAFGALRGVADGGDGVVGDAHVLDVLVGQVAQGAVPDLVQEHARVAVGRCAGDGQHHHAAHGHGAGVAAEGRPVGHEDDDIRVDGLRLEPDLGQAGRGWPGRSCASWRARRSTR